MALTPAVKAAKQNTKVAKSLSARARESKRRVESARANAVASYGQALAGSVGLSFEGAMARGQAGVDTSRSLTKQSAAQTTIAQESDATYAAVAPAMAKGQAGAMARVRQNAQPGFISARAAMAEANAYAARIGIDMKKMKWEAKAAIYQSVIDQNGQMAQMVFQQEMALQQQEAMYDLQKQEESEAALAGAGAVVNTVTNTMPSMLQEVERIYAEEADKEDYSPAVAATEWATSVTVDPAAAKLLSAVMADILVQGKGHYIGEYTLDPEWVTNTLTNSITAAYPGYSPSRDTISSAMTPAVHGARIANASSSGDGNWFTNDPFWANYAQRGQEGAGFAAPFLAAADTIMGS
jgi:hypothetical protein